MSKAMTPKKIIKKQISKLKDMKTKYPMLVDCSRIYGDDYFNDVEYKKLCSMIEAYELRLADMEIIE